MNMPDWKKFPYVIFDMDGTLVDSMPYWRRLGRDYLLSCGKEPEDDLEKIIAPMTLRESAVYFRDHYRLEETPEEIIHGFETLMEENYRLRIPAKPGAAELVRSLHLSGKYLSICSATPVPLVQVMLARLGILSCFSHITSCEEAGAGKDRPEAYLLAMERADCRPEETLLFEDADFAVRTAKEIGMHVIAVHDSTCRMPAEEMKQLADLYIESFTELL